MSTVKMNALSIGGLIQTQFSGNVQVPADGIITVDTRDAATLLAAGAGYITAKTKQQYISAPLAGTVGRIVASTAFANGTLTIANQPDSPRLCSIRVDPGTTAITGGVVTVNYVGCDGQTTIDTVSAVTAASTVVSTNTSKGVAKVNSVVVTGVAGGTSPQIQVDTLNSLAVAADAGYVDFSVVDLKVDNVDSGVASTQSSAACFTPSTAPNGTHNYQVVAVFNSPVT